MKITLIIWEDSIGFIADVFLEVSSETELFWPIITKITVIAAATITFKAIGFAYIMSV